MDSIYSMISNLRPVDRTTHLSLCTHLQVVLWVPVWVEDDAGVGRRQVDAQASGSGAQQENKAVRVRLTEPVDGSLPQVASHAPVDAFVRVAGENTDRCSTSGTALHLLLLSEKSHSPLSSFFFSTFLHFHPLNQLLLPPSSPSLDEVVL